MFGSSQVKGNIIIKNVILIRVKFVHIQPNDTQLISNWLTSTSELSSVYLRSIQHEDKSSEIDANNGLFTRKSELFYPIYFTQSIIPWFHISKIYRRLYISLHLFRNF